MKEKTDVLDLILESKKVKAEKNAADRLRFSLS